MSLVCPLVKFGLTCFFVFWAAINIAVIFWSILTSADYQPLRPFCRSPVVTQPGAQCPVNISTTAALAVSATDTR